MTKHNDTHQTPEIHLHDDPVLVETESLLDELGSQDRSAMPDGLETRVLDSISAAIAPSPLSMNQPAHPGLTKRIWAMRLAAAAVLATGTTLVIVSARPWESAINTNTPEIALTTFEQDMDAYLALEPMDDGALSQAVTEWKIWAQSVDTEIDTTLLGFDLEDPTQDDGAL